MYHIRHHAPDREFGAGKVDVDGGQPGGLGDQPDLVECSLKTADQHFAVQRGDNYLPVGSLHRAVDDDDIAVEDTRADHGVAVHPHEESVRLIPYQLLIQIDTPLFMACAEELFDFHDKMFEGNGIFQELRSRENILVILIYLVNLC